MRGFWSTIIYRRTHRWGGTMWMCGCKGVASFLNSICVLYVANALDHFYFYIFLRFLSIILVFNQIGHMLFDQDHLDGVVTLSKFF
jgi:hypothetical protein